MEIKKDLNPIHAVENAAAEVFSHHHKLSIGQRAADNVTNLIGNWKFILAQLFLLVVWVIMNLVGWFYHWDPRPFILLNLLLSIQAAFAAPIIMMSQNRTAERDRHKAEMDLATDRKSEREIEEMQKKLETMDRKINEIRQILTQK